MTNDETNDYNNIKKQLSDIAKLLAYTAPYQGSLVERLESIIRAFELRGERIKQLEDQLYGVRKAYNKMNDYLNGILT